MGAELGTKITTPEIPSTKKYVAELIGTMVLVLMGCGSAVIAGQNITFTGIALLSVLQW
jgi:glycerol uptake facilitator-like aquaporin